MLFRQSIATKALLNRNWKNNHYSDVIKTLEINHFNVTLDYHNLFSLFLFLPSNKSSIASLTPLSKALASAAV